MPTFKNTTNKPIEYITAGKDILIIDPNEIKELEYWIPYQQLGLELLNESYPPVPNEILLNGTFKFMAGMTRKFDIEPCTKYALSIKNKGASILLYLGGSKSAIEITDEYSDIFSWEYAPFIRVQAPSGDSYVQIFSRKDC